jgi:hypothetical protein
VLKSLIKIKKAKKKCLALLQTLVPIKHLAIYANFMDSFTVVLELI